MSGMRRNERNADVRCHTLGMACRGGRSDQMLIGRTLGRNDDR
jgi:hypothetical protein